MNGKPRSVILHRKQDEEDIDTTGVRMAIDTGIWKTVAGLVLILYAVYSYRRTLPPLGAIRRTVLGTLRALTFLLLVLFMMDPAVVSRTTGLDRAVVPVLVDVSGSMGFGSEGEARRIEQALLSARRIGRSIEGADVVYLPFAGEMLEAVSAPDSVAFPAAEGTDIFGAIESADRRFRHGKTPAIVLLTDGRVTRGMTSTGYAPAVPVLAIVFGDTLEGVELAVDGVEYERTVYTGTRVPVEVTARYTGAAGEEIRARLIDGENTVETATSGPVSGDGRVEIGLSFVPSEPGLKELSVVLEEIEGERHLENNRERFRVRVLDDRVGVLFIDRYPDWNMSFLGRIVSSTGRFELTPVTWRPGSGYELLKEGDPWRLERADLSRFSMIMIGDTEEPMPEAEIRALREHVEGGGGLLFFASGDSPLLSVPGRGALEEVLPLSRTGIPSIQTGEFFVTRGSGPGDSPSGGLEKVFERVDGLPPMPAAISGYVPSADSRTALYMRSGSGRRPFLVLAGRGRGMTGAILGYPLWRWPLAGEDGKTAYEEMMAGLLQYMSGGHRESGIDVSTDRTVYLSGERPRITAGIRDPADPGRSLRGLVRPEGGGPGRVIMLDPVRSRPGLWETAAGPLPPGDYVIEVPAGEEQGGRASISVEEVSIESRRTASNPELVREIASGTGGAVFRPGSEEELAAMIDAEPRRYTRRSVRRLRESALMLLAVIAVMTAEWGLRKAWGLI